MIFESVGCKSVTRTFNMFLQLPSLDLISQEDQTTVEVDIDPRVHRRLIGARGASIRRVMEQFKVDIRFPRSDNPDGPVAISGAPENVDDAKDHLLILEEEYVSNSFNIYSIIGIALT